MNQELEIEFKNQLTKDEYQRIFETEFSSISTSTQIKQTNHYFDTRDKRLKIQGAALRIRTTDTHNELTFKVPAEGFLMETNIPLDDEQVKTILNKGYFSLSEITDENIVLKLNNITNQTVFEHFNSFETKRFEKQVAEHLIVLDQTSFQNGFVDYELELESSSSTLGREYFHEFLDKYSIPQRVSLPKIARAEKNK